MQATENPINRGLNRKRFISENKSPWFHSPGLVWHPHGDRRELFLSSYPLPLACEPLSSCSCLIVVSWLLYLQASPLFDGQEEGRMTWR